MLRKLIKYEFKSTYTIFLSMYIVSLSLSAIGGIAFRLMENRINMDLMGFFTNMYMGMYVLMIIAIMFLTIGLCVTRFYKSMTSSEGYLTHTLPVSIDKIIISKLITSSIWYLASSIAVFLSIITLISASFGIEVIQIYFARIFELLSMISVHKLQFTLAIFLFTLSIIATIAYTFLMFYSSIAIGQLNQKRRVLVSVCSFIGINIINNFINGFNFVFTVMKSSLRIDNIPSEGFVENAPRIIFSLLNNSVLIQLVLTIILSLVLFFVTRYIFKNKLNLA